MAGGMAGLYIGVSGMHAAQTSLDVTAHNLSNIGTDGYTRQQVTYMDSQYFKVATKGFNPQQYGVGVGIQDIRRVRDEFLDRSYRQENGRAAFYESQYSAVEEIESLFGEMDGVAFEDSINDLWEALNEVAKNPGSTVTRSALVQSSVSFLDRATAIYDGLVDYQNMLNTKIDDMVNRINELGKTIYDLNKEINYIENTGESANDKRDERDRALDELSALVKLDYYEDVDHQLVIHIEGAPFIDGSSFFPMVNKEILDANGASTGLYQPTWPNLEGRAVFALNEEFNSLNNNDIGELKGLLLARGSMKVNYENVPVEPNTADYYDDAGTFDRTSYDADYAKYVKDSSFYNKNIDNSVVLATMAGFDKLINGMVTALNDVLCPETSYTATEDIVDADGNVILAAGETAKILDMDATAYGMDLDQSVGVELFSRANTDRYLTGTYVDGNGQTQTVYVRNDLSVKGMDSKYTLGNIEVNNTILQNYETIPLSGLDGSENFAKAEELLDVWDVNFAALNPDKYAKEDFRSFYNSLISDIANTGQQLNNMTEYQQAMASELDNKRQESIGVASDEELTNMIKFQNAYNAASRYINVVSEMMEHVVTALGG
ncbi:MAG: flagellar hook-associated protein FlgK [Lachnospiraceae bacterium]|nr:flagellar hook-associated protein FlgK [Lachnospiraceae bacterium]